MKVKKKLNSFLYNHLWLKQASDYVVPLFVTIISAALFSFGLNAFIQPELLDIHGTTSMVSGGASGAAQVIKTIFEVFGVKKVETLKILYNGIYALINIPLIILAYVGVGKKFTIFTIINVGCVILFNFLFTAKGNVIVGIAREVSTQNGGPLDRALFAGVCTGLSSALAYKVDSSAGGFDIIAYYIGNKKSTMIGKYGTIINGIVIFSFTFISSFKEGINVSTAIISGCYSLVYLVMVNVVVDVINIRNKKAQIQIISSKKDLPKLLITNIPHGATVSTAKGVFTDDEKLIIYMVVSITEVKRSVAVIKELDPESFVNVTPLQAVYGNFHMKPIK